MAAVSSSESSLDEDDGMSDLFDDSDFEDFRSPTKRMGNATRSTLPPPPPKFELPNLIETATLKQLGMKYNVQYHMVICVECQAGYPFNYAVKHALKGTKQYSVYDPIKKQYVQPNLPKHNRPRILRESRVKKTGGEVRMTEEEIKKAILSEIKALGYNGTPHSLPDPSIAGLQAWAHLAVPHPGQKGPIDGLRSFPHGFRCTVGSCAGEDFPRCSLTWDVLRRHIKDQHGVKADRNQVDEGVTLQTLCGSKNFNVYFVVPPGGDKVALESPISNEISLTDALLLHQRNIYGDLTRHKGLDTDLIDPVYSTVGMTEFWKTFDFAAIRPLQKIVPLSRNKDLPEDQQVIAQAVVATFFEISLHARSGSTPVLNLIAKGAA